MKRRTPAELHVGRHITACHRAALNTVHVVLATFMLTFRAMIQRHPRFQLHPNHVVAFGSLITPARFLHKLLVWVIAGVIYAAITPKERAGIAMLGLCGRVNFSAMFKFHCHLPFRAVTPNPSINTDWRDKAAVLCG